MYYKESLIDDDAHWAAASGTSIINMGTALSGTTLTQIAITPVGLGFMKVYLRIQGNAVSKFRAILKFFNKSW